MYHKSNINAIIIFTFCEKIFGAILIKGPKWCGKTWTAKNYALSIVCLDEEIRKTNEFLSTLRELQ